MESSERWRLCPVVHIYHSAVEKNEIKYSFSASQIYLAHTRFALPSFTFNWHIIIVLWGHSDVVKLTGFIFAVSIPLGILKGWILSYLTAILHSRVLGRGLEGLEPVSAAYGWRQGTPLYVSSLQGRMWAFGGLVPCSKVRWCSVTSPTTKTPFKFYLLMTLNSQPFDCQPRPIRTEILLVEFTVTFIPPN